MDIVKISGIALTAALAVVVLKQLRPEMEIAVKLAAFAVLLGAALPLLISAVNFSNDLLEVGGATRFAPYLWKALGIALLTEIGAGVCRDCGAGSVGDALELYGRWEVLVISLPLFQEILTVAKELLAL